MADEQTVTLETVVTANSGLMVSEVDGELVMMDIEKGTYYGLDPVAARIWQAVGQPTRVADVCAQMLEQFDVDQDRCEAEVLAFIADLQSSGLVSCT